MYYNRVFQNYLMCKYYSDTGGAALVGMDILVVGFWKVILSLLGEARGTAHMSTTVLGPRTFTDLLLIHQGFQIRREGAS